jgi:hypothetical protein
MEIVDEESRQFILMLEKRQAERDRELRQWFDERDRNFRRWLDEFAADSIRRHEEVMAEITSHRKALFGILDRLDRGGGAAPA